MERCSNCDSDRIVRNGGTRVCSDCNMIQSEEMYEECEANVGNQIVTSTHTIISKGMTKRDKSFQKYDSSTSYEANRRALMDEVDKLLANAGISDHKNIMENVLNEYFNYAIKDHTPRRGNVKWGVIARIFELHMKESYHLYSKAELAQIFGIPKASISSGTKVLSSLCQANVELREHFDQTPINIIDAMRSSFKLFPEIVKQDDIAIFVNRIRNMEKVLVNTPMPVIAAVFLIYAERMRLPLNMKIIRSRLDVSESSIRRYYKYFRMLIPLYRIVTLKQV